MTQIDPSNLTFFSVNGQKVPCEGARAIPIPLDFSLSTEYDLDLSNLVQRGFISMIQAVWMDNSANASPLSVSFPNSGQVITMAPNRQGYRVVLCPNPPRIAFLSQGGIFCKVFLLNFPVTNSDWPCVTGA